ncbi:MAG TPA: glycosyltransferase family 2 protein [Solirubrobacteraceae bacterium]|nr:glycosyltransferase family 2 protein [Solirubrobacteraceae bacterium]
MPSSIDVVIVAYNRYDLTGSCLRHLQAQTVEHHVIVVDNGSTDDTRVRLREEWPALQVEAFDENRGFPEACNRGVAAGRGEIVVLLNNDVDCRPDFLERLVAPLGDPTVGSVVPLLLQPGEKGIDSVGLAADSILAGFPRLRGMSPASAHEDTPVLAGAAGTAAAYRRAAWEEVGGLDETIFCYMEDFDLALRLRMAGWRAVVEVEAIGVHLGSATHGHRTAWQRRHAGFGRGYMLRRYGLLHGRTALRALATEAIVVVGDLLISRDTAALRGRLAGWRAGRTRPRLPLPPADCLDLSIDFRDSLAMRRGIYRRPVAGALARNAAVSSSAPGVPIS